MSYVLLQRYKVCFFFNHGITGAETFYESVDASSPITASAWARERAKDFVTLSKVAVRWQVLPSTIGPVNAL